MYNLKFILRIKKKKTDFLNKNHSLKIQLNRLKEEKQKYESFR